MRAQSRRKRVQLGSSAVEHKEGAARARRHRDNALRYVEFHAERGECEAAVMHYEDALVAHGKLIAHAEAVTGGTGGFGYKARRLLERRCGLPGRD